MSTPPFDTARPPPAAPSSGEFTTAWIAYASFGFGLLMWWPNLIGLVIAYVRRGDPATGFIDRHYRWLIRTFWWSLLWYLTAIAVFAAGVGPVICDIVGAAIEQRGAGTGARVLLDLPWRSLATAAGLTVVGGLGVFAIWCWTAYRVISGALRLGRGIGAP